MNSGEYDRFFEMLELSPNASLSEVKQAYSRLMELYSGDSMAVNPLESEFNESRRLEIIKNIDEAYKRLTGMFYMSRDIKDQPELSDKINSSTDDGCYTGSSLRLIREKLRLDLRDIELATKVGRNHLKNIELEKFGALPEAVYIQGYVRAYARCLSLDAQRVTDDYMKRYKEWEDGKE
jgi:hypothetical protein